MYFSETVPVIYSEKVFSQKFRKILTKESLTVWKVSKYRGFSDSYYPVFRRNMGIYYVNLRIQSKYAKIRTGKNYTFHAVPGLVFSL